MREFVVYTLSRLGLFLVAYAVIAGVYLAATGESVLPMFWPLVAAIIVSSVASVYLLRGQRARFAAAVERRAAAAKQRADERRETEQRDEERRDEG